MYCMRYLYVVAAPRAHTDGNRDDGMPEYNREKCIGCGVCVIACVPQHSTGTGIGRGVVLCSRERGGWEERRLEHLAGEKGK